MTNLFEQVGRFQSLFSGLETAFGTGAGRWVKRPPTANDFLEHLRGEGQGIGIAPLRPDSTVLFAAIDLDEPDFIAANEMQQYIPGFSHLERSRSGNAHVWVFFREPIEAWVAMGILREATFAAGKERVEVFPKNPDFAKVKVGNYINLPFHGNDRVTLERVPREYVGDEDRAIYLGSESKGWLVPQDLERFLEGAADRNRNDPDDWHKRANWLSLEPPQNRERSAEFGTQRHLHMCAEYVVEQAEERPITAGHRSIVYFNLAKMYTNCELYSHEETLEFMKHVNSCSPDPISTRELKRILANAERGQFTSTGCDDPVFAPFAHPGCPIANG